jgi:hypothetical protein
MEGYVLFEPFELLSGGKAAEDKKVGDLEKVALFGQLLYGDAPVFQNRYSRTPFSPSMKLMADSAAGIPSSPGTTSTLSSNLHLR